MKKISTTAARQTRNFQDQKLTIGLDLGDRSSWYCVLDEAGEVLLEQKLATTPKAMKEVFVFSPPCMPARKELGDCDLWFHRYDGIGPGDRRSHRNSALGLWACCLVCSSPWIEATLRPAARLLAGCAVVRTLLH
jgi:hypothetical protein